VPTGSAAEGPPYNDEHVLHKVRRADEFTLSTEGSSQKFRGEAVRELGYSGPNAWMNKHAPSKDYDHKSRCRETTMRPDDGQTEQAYFRIDALKSGTTDNHNFDPCFINTRMHPRITVSASGRRNNDLQRTAAHRTCTENRGESSIAARFA